MYNDLLGSRKHATRSFSCPSIANLITLSVSKLNPAMMLPQNCKTFRENRIKMLYKIALRATLLRLQLTWLIIINIAPYSSESENNVPLPWHCQYAALSIPQALSLIYARARGDLFPVGMLPYGLCRGSVCYLHSTSSIRFLYSHVSPTKKVQKSWQFRIKQFKYWNAKALNILLTLSQCENS